MAAQDRQAGLPAVLPLPLAAPPLAFTIPVLRGVWALSTLPQPGNEDESRVWETGIDGLARWVADEATALGRLAHKEA